MQPLSVAAVPKLRTGIDLAVPEGLEPPTLALGKPCSIRLSYEATRADGCHAFAQAPSLCAFGGRRALSAIAARGLPP